MFQHSYATHNLAMYQLTIEKYNENLKSITMIQSNFAKQIQNHLID